MRSPALYVLSGIAIALAIVVAFVNLSPGKNAPAWMLFGVPEGSR